MRTQGNDTKKMSKKRKITSETFRCSEGTLGIKTNEVGWGTRGTVEQGSDRGGDCKTNSGDEGLLDRRDLRRVCLGTTASRTETHFYHPIELQSRQPYVFPRRGGRRGWEETFTNLLFKYIDHLFEVLSDNISLQNVRNSIHLSILVGEFNVDSGDW